MFSSVNFSDRITITGVSSDCFISFAPLLQPKQAKLRIAKNDLDNNRVINFICVKLFNNRTTMAFLKFQ